jgi:hypothetical protein
VKITCPHCKAVIPASQLNVGTDVAVCEKCNEAFSLSALAAGGKVTPGFDIHEPPCGAWFEETSTGWRIGATTRSPVAFFLVPFMCVWSGFTLGGIYGSQIINGEFDIGISLFGIPFLLGTLLFGSIAVMSVCGKEVIEVEGDDGRVFAGVGPIGWTWRFNWASISSIEEDFSNHQHGGNSGRVIALVGQTKLQIAGIMSESRRYYLLQCLRKFLADRGR